jgi:hypothetical protein
MGELRIVSDKKVDHPRKKSKDLADAMCGAVYNAISHTPRNRNQEIEIHDWKSISRSNEQKQKDIITPPTPTKDISEYLSSFGIF